MAALIVTYEPGNISLVTHELGWRAAVTLRNCIVLCASVGKKAQKKLGNIIPHDVLLKTTLKVDFVVLNDVVNVVIGPTRIQTEPAQELMSVWQKC